MSKATESIEIWNQSKRGEPEPKLPFIYFSGGGRFEVTLSGDLRVSSAGFIYKEDAFKLAQWIIDTFGEKK